MRIAQLSPEQIQKIKVAVSKDKEALTSFLKDKIYETSERFSGYFAIAEKVQRESFYVTTLYHERFAFENPKTRKTTSGAGE
ncbi:MAG: hypothetical protein NZM05_12500 [Chloroherpetonaceae bacterium]|nr:hypothetical protein [Chloroherpetonaceae bacterium]